VLTTNTVSRRIVRYSLSVALSTVLGRTLSHPWNGNCRSNGNWNKVFENWYDVRGMEEFKLSKEVNGTVIRYAYAVGKKTVDMGIVRRK